MQFNQEWISIVMAEDFQLRHVGTVAMIIGGTVLVLGMLGLLLLLG